MTRRGVLTLLLGLAVYVIAWLFGAKALYPVAVGLVLAPLAARRHVFRSHRSRSPSGSRSWASATHRSSAPAARTAAPM